jgi:hypothetical protein
MRSLAEVRKHRVVVVGGGHPREGELRRLLEHADFEVIAFHRRGSEQELSLSDAMLDAEMSPPPDAIVLAAGSVITTLRALEQHPVLRWVDPIVAPWSALDEGASTPLRIAQLLVHLQASEQDRLRVARELANARRAVFQLAPLGPLPLMLAAARTKGTTLVFESGVGRARISLAHGRFVGGRATDAAQLRTVRGIEALAVALRIPEAEVLVVNDEEDEPIGERIEDALHAAIGMEPTIEMSSSSFLRPAPRVVEPRQKSVDALKLPGKREATLRFGKPLVEDEPHTKLWHRPLAREWPESPREKRHEGTQRYGFPAGVEADEDEASTFGLPESAVRETTGVQALQPSIQSAAALAETLRANMDAARPPLETTLVTHAIRGTSEALQTLPPPPPPMRSSWALTALACSVVGMAAALWLYALPASPVRLEAETSPAVAMQHLPASPTTRAVASTPSTPSAALFATPAPSLEALLAPTEAAPTAALEPVRRHRRHPRRARLREATAPEAAAIPATSMPTSSMPTSVQAAPATAEHGSAPSITTSVMPATTSPPSAAPAPTRDPGMLMPPDSV